MYDIKALYEASSPQEASRLLLEHPEAILMAGGSDVLIKIREGKLAGREIVSIHGLDELRGVALTYDGTLRIGSLSTFTYLARHELIKKHIPVLGEAVSQVGGPQVRNVGTIGGNTCNGVTSADSATTLLAYDAEVELWGPEGVRLLPLEDFYLAAGKVDLRPGELQVAILIRQASYAGYFGEYIKYSMRKAMDIATLGCSVNLRLTEDGKRLQDVRMAFGVAGPVPLRARQAEDYGRGKALGGNLCREIAERCKLDTNPRDSWRASKSLREHLIVVCAERALHRALHKAEAK